MVRSRGMEASSGQSLKRNGISSLILSRCFLNKTSNFDALPSGSLKIGYSLIHSTVFDYGSFVLKSLSDKKSDKLGSVCFIRFFQLIFCHLCPSATFEEDVVLPICRITDNNVKSLVNSDKANGFKGNAFIPNEVRLFLQEKMPTYYGTISDAMGQGQSHLVPDTSIPPKQSKQSTTTSTVSQKTVVVKSKKSARSDVSGRQSGSKDFSSTPLTQKKSQGGVQGVLVKKADKVEEVVNVKIKLVLRDETDSEDDMLISSKFRMNKKVVDIASEVVAQTAKPHKKRKLAKSRYHIPLKKQDIDGQDTSIPDEQSNPDAQANPDIGIPNASQSKIVSISDSPAKASPTSRILEIPWEKVAETASKLGFTHPMEKKMKAEEKVFQRQKKLKGSSPQEPEPQSGSAATEDPATQEPLTQSPHKNHLLNVKIQARKQQFLRSFLTMLKGLIIFLKWKSWSRTVTKGSTQEPLTQSVEASSEPQATQEPLVQNTDASISNPDSVAPDASGAPDAEPILIQPLSSRPMQDPISESKDKLKGVVDPDADKANNSGHSDDDDSDDDNDVEKDHLATSLKSSLGTNFAEQLKRHEWENEWYRSDDPVSYPCALEHASYAAANNLVMADISQSLAKTPTALQLRVTDIQASLSLILNLLSNPDVKKGEKLSKTKCTPDLVLRKNNDDDHTGHDGDDLVLQGETSDAAIVKSTIQTSQSQSTQSTHVSDSGVRTVRTLVKSQILTEELILTGDQILTVDQILTHGHRTLTTIPEGDEDALIENPEDAANLFQKFKTRDGNVLTLYHTDKRVQQLFARKVLSTASEEYHDLSHEEFLSQQREMMESFNNHAPARGRGGRGRRGARRGRRSNQTVPRQTRLDKALYGLKQAPRAWYETLAQFLLESGFKRGTIDKTLFYFNHGKILLLVQIYVDDIIFGSTNNKSCEKFSKLMQSRYQMSMMGEMTYFLGLQVKQTYDGIFINQSKYTRNLLKRFNMQDCATASTPIATATKLDPDQGAEVDVTHYREMIGSLLYLTASRPDIMFATCLCARFQANPREPHLIAVKRIFRYLKGTPSLSLWYARESDFGLCGYSDADFAGCKIDRKSISGSCQFLGGRLVSWFNKKQKSISTSTVEAEYIAAGSCCAQITWMRNQLLDYGPSYSKIPIYCDNQSAIAMTGNPV
ncbi:hypothetical protein POM88_018008 [Heracleum sosnowskyi]|uniref:Reverse transcriptase Ty1/copia-type domain-containing protein n=1 Tax=Heracleum sosnowskyi TaxID=360622 RepID=A0AAD8ITK9_9APIA|nr:hypothetical protein POM88_018008 [Heracleum sosnowskyi]